MVELVEDGSKGLSDVSEIHDPAQFFVELSLQMQRDPKGVTVKAGALVPLRNVGEAVCGLDAELLEDLHDAANAKPYALE